MNSVFDLLNEDIIPGVGIGELQIGRTRKSLSELFFSDFECIRGDMKLSRSISIEFSKSGYLSKIELTNEYKGSIFGYITLGSYFEDLQENFCHLYEENIDEEHYEPGLFSFRIFNERAREPRTILDFGKNIWKNTSTAVLKSIIIYEDYYYVEQHISQQ